MELYFTLFILLLIIFYIQLGVYIILEMKNPTKPLGWLLLSYSLPIIGFLLYIVIRKRWSISKDLDRSEYFSRAANQQTQLFFEGRALFNHLFTQLSLAKYQIHIGFFIIRDDHVGQRMKEILMTKALSGCQVRLIYDGIGSISLSKKFIKELRDAGVEAYSFLPLTFPWLTPRLNTRYHRKIVVIDGDVGYLGGFNIGKEYVGEDPKLGHWRDAHLMIRGGSVDALQRVFLKDWYVVSKQKVDHQYDIPQSEIHPIKERQITDIVWSGPNSAFPYSLHQILSFLYKAKKTVLIATPYLVPDPSLLTVLKERALAGIEVLIMLPNKTDHRLVYYATHSYFEELLVAGVKIYLYQTGFMHSKMMICDHTAFFLGTTNLDMRSFFLNYEVNAVIHDLDTIKVAKEQFEHDLNECEEVTLTSFQNRKGYIKLAEGIARLFSPLL